MALPLDHPHQIVISEDQARGGVTGHNVRYVLALGLTGVIAAFAGLAVYAGYDDIQARLSAVMANSPSDMLRACAPYAALGLVAAISAGLLLGIWTLLAGRSEDGSQSFMRARVVGQFVLIGVIMALFWMARGA
jgi:Hypoxia induced protein conserved region